MHAMYSFFDYYYYIFDCDEIFNIRQLAHFEKLEKEKQKSATTSCIACKINIQRIYLQVKRLRNTELLMKKQLVFVSVSSMTHFLQQFTYTNYNFTIYALYLSSPLIQTQKIPDISYKSSTQHTNQQHAIEFEKNE